MARIDFLISNDRHHRAMSWPVAAALAKGAAHRVRLLSLCELRGLATPPADSAPPGTELLAVVPWRLRRSPSVGQMARPGSPSTARRAAHTLAWWLPLAPRLAVAWARPPDLVVLPNDAAFPFDRIARLLRARRIPFLLLQEGIRFPLTGQRGVAVYGAGGATAVAAWGEASADYFRSVGVPPERVHLTGCPRFDHLPAAVSAARSCHTLLLATNPIDDQGLCSHAEKLALVERFLREIEPLFADPRFHLAIKLHGREEPAEIERLVPERSRRRVTIHTDTPLEELFAAAGAVAVLASTVGLEALLHGLPLAVLEIPGHGFQYDYVAAGAAVGLGWSTPMAPQVEAVFEPSEQRRAGVEAYLGRQLANRGRATECVADRIRRLLSYQR